MKRLIAGLLAMSGLMLAAPAGAQTPSGGLGPGAPASQPGTPVSPSSPTTPGGPGTMNPPAPSTGATTPGVGRPGSTTPGMGTNTPGAATPGGITPGTNVPGRGRDLGLPCPAGQARPTGSSMCSPVTPGSPVSPPTTR